MRPNDPALPSSARHRKKGPARQGQAAVPGRHVRFEVPVEAIDEPSDCHCPFGYHEFGVHAPAFGPRQAPPLVPLPGVYRIDDLAALSPGEADALVRRARADAERHAVRCPHILITRDRDSGAITHDGPFPTGLEAMEQAHRYLVQNLAVDLSWAFTLTVAPLFSPSWHGVAPARTWWRRASS